MLKSMCLLAAAACSMCLTSTAAHAQTPPAAPAVPRAPLKAAFTPTAPKLDPATGTAILPWKDGKRAAFYLAFDDACPTHLTNVIPELQKRKIIGTFYVIAGSGMFKGNAGWVEAAKSPYVVLANHTLTHKDFPTMEKFESELAAANEIIRQVQPGNTHRLLSFGKPGGVTYGISEEQLTAALPKHDLIYRLSFTQLQTLQQMDAQVDQALAAGTLSHLDFHGVGGDWLVTPTETLHALLDKLEANRDSLWITDAATAQKYAAERAAATVKVVERSDRQIRLNLTASTDPALYDQPLTLALKVPAGWPTVRVTQGTTTATVTSTEAIVRFDAVPNGAEITLAPN